MITAGAISKFKDVLSNALEELHKLEISINQNKPFCPSCLSTNLFRVGYTQKRIQRYRCLNDECQTKTFICKHNYTPNVIDRLNSVQIESN